MAFSSITNQRFISAEDGVSPVTGSLGTITTTVQLNRGTVQAGPPGTDNGNGTFTVDLSAYSGFAIQVQVISTNPHCLVFSYADAVADPLPAYNITDFADALKGERCNRTGLWCPASRIKRVQGIPFYDIVAPDIIYQPIPELPFVKQVSSTTNNTPSTGPYGKPS